MTLCYYGAPLASLIFLTYCFGKHFLYYGALFLSVVALTIALRFIMRAKGVASSTSIIATLTVAILTAYFIPVPLKGHTFFRELINWATPVFCIALQLLFVWRTNEDLEDLKGSDLLDKMQMNFVMEIIFFVLPAILCCFLERWWVGFLLLFLLCVYFLTTAIIAEDHFVSIAATAILATVSALCLITYFTIAVKRVNGPLLHWLSLVGIPLLSITLQVLFSLLPGKHLAVVDCKQYWERSRIYFIFAVIFFFLPGIACCVLGKWIIGILLLSCAVIHAVFRVKKYLAVSDLEMFLKHYHPPLSQSSTTNWPRNYASTDRRRGDVCLSMAPPR